jgi:hypothetical protein
VYQPRYKSFPIQDDDQFFYRVQVGGTPCAAGRLGVACRGLAMGFIVAVAAKAGAESSAAVAMANMANARLG